MELFVNYRDYRIQLDRPALAVGLVVLILVVAVVLSARRTKSTFFDFQTAQSLRGLAVIFLILGHLGLRCLAEKSFIQHAAYWAVIVFLFISGYGVYQRYGFRKVGRAFAAKRLTKLYPPLWISLALFLLLDRLLVDLRHPWLEVTLNFLGVHATGALTRINSPAWFVGYLLYLYGVYCGISLLALEDKVKIGLLLAASLATSLVIRYSPLYEYIGVSCQHAVVFPCGVLLSWYQSRPSERLLRQKNVTIVLALLISAGTFLAAGRFASDPSRPMMFRILLAVPFLCALVAILVLLDRSSYRSRVLTFLGDYSYEIYLLHLPFMVKYDFFLFRQPFVVFFLVYLLFLISLSVLLRKASQGLQQVLTPTVNRLLGSSHRADQTC